MHSVKHLKDLGVQPRAPEVPIPWERATYRKGYEMLLKLRRATPMPKDWYKMKAEAYRLIADGEPVPELEKYRGFTAEGEDIDPEITPKVFDVVCKKDGFYIYERGKHFIPTARVKTNYKIGVNIFLEDVIVPKGSKFYITANEWGGFDAIPEDFPGFQQPGWTIFLPWEHIVKYFEPIDDPFGLKTRQELS